MKNEKSKNIIIALLSIMIVGLAGLICYHTFIVNKKEEPKGEKTTTTENILVKKIELTEDEQTVAINGGSISIHLTKENSNKESYLVINGKTTSFVSQPLSFISDIYVMKDIIIIPIYSTDVRGNKLYIIDKNGNILKEVNNNLDGTANGMGIAAGENSITFNSNKIIIKGTRLSHGPSLIYGDKYIDPLCNNDKTLKENDISDDLVVEATYEIEYLGNNKLSDIKMADGTGKTLKQAKTEYCK